MKKLMIVCMVAAIGAVTMIEKSNAAPADCQLQGLCGGAFGKNGPASGPMPGAGGSNVNQGHQGIYNPGNQPWKHNNPNWQANGNNGNNQWWLNHHHHHYNNGPSIGFGIYTGPSYYDDPYYDNDYGYGPGPDPYAYGTPRTYSSSGRCDAWADRLHGMGYRNIHATDCSGSSYVYRATKSGRPVKVTVRASSGSVIRVASAY